MNLLVFTGICVCGEISKHMENTHSKFRASAASGLGAAEGAARGGHPPAGVAVRSLSLASRRRRWPCPERAHTGRDGPRAIVLRGGPGTLPPTLAVTGGALGVSRLRLLTPTETPPEGACASFRGWCAPRHGSHGLVPPPPGAICLDSHRGVAACRGPTPAATTLAKGFVCEKHQGLGESVRMRSVRDAHAATGPTTEPTRDDQTPVWASGRRGVPQGSSGEPGTRHSDHLGGRGGQGGGVQAPGAGGLLVVPACPCPACVGLVSPTCPGLRMGPAAATRGHSTWCPGRQGTWPQSATQQVLRQVGSHGNRITEGFCPSSSPAGLHPKVEAPAASMGSHLTCTGVGALWGNERVVWGAAVPGRRALLPRKGQRLDRSRVGREAAPGPPARRRGRPWEGAM